jgi:hypothetical protein
MKKFASLCAVALLCTGCAVVTTQALNGFFYSEMTSPGSISGANLGGKSGTSSAESFLGLIARGDAGIHAAATGAGLSSVSHVDYKSYSILGVYAKIETYAYGN